jgi:hypothetical protein
MNPHSTPVELIWALLHGELSPAEQAEARARLNATPEGRAALAEAGIAHRLLAKSLPAERDDEALVTEILAELEADLPDLEAKPEPVSLPAAASERGWRGPRFWIPAAAAACLAAALLGARLLPGVTWDNTRVIPAVYQAAETPADPAGLATFERFGDELRAALETSFAQAGRPAGRWRLAVTVKELKAGAELVVQATSRGNTREWTLRIDSAAHFAEIRDDFVGAVTRDIRTGGSR